MYFLFDLDLDPMILTLVLDLNIVKMWQTARQIHTQIEQTEIITYPHTWMIQKTDSENEISFNMQR